MPFPSACISTPPQLWSHTHSASLPHMQSACHSQLTWLNPVSNHLLATSYHTYLIGLGSFPLHVVAISQLQAGGRLLPKLFWWLKWKLLLVAASQPLKNQPLCSLWHFSQWLLHLWGASDGPGDHNTNMCLSAAGLWLLSYCRSQMTFLIESESNCGVSCHYRDHDTNMCLSAVYGPGLSMLDNLVMLAADSQQRLLPKILFCESKHYK